MPKLYFRYGTMNSSKSANLLMVAHNYKSQGKKVLLVKPAIDTRFGSDMIDSRAIEGVQADLVIDEHFSDFSQYCNVNCILVDEASLMSACNIEGLRQAAKQVPVICYGLRTDFTGHLFPGSKRLMELADTIEEVKTVCVECDRKATMNAKFKILPDGTKKIVYKPDGDSVIDIGAEEKYQPMCFQCWIE